MQKVLNYGKILNVVLMRIKKKSGKEVPKVQYKEELVKAASDIYTEIETRRFCVLEQIQLHAVNQIKNGFTSFRISKLKKSEERYLEEWASMTNANISVIKFKCFENEKRYVVRQFVVDLKGSMKLDYELEGKTLIIE